MLYVIYFPEFIWLHWWHDITQLVLQVEVCLAISLKYCISKARNCIPHVPTVSDLATVVVLCRRLDSEKPTCAIVNYAIITSFYHVTVRHPSTYRASRTLDLLVYQKGVVRFTQHPSRSELNVNLSTSLLAHVKPVDKHRHRHLASLFGWVKYACSGVNDWLLINFKIIHFFLVGCAKWRINLPFFRRRLIEVLSKAGVQDTRATFSTPPATRLTRAGIHIAQAGRMANRTEMTTWVTLHLSTFAPALQAKCASSVFHLAVAGPNVAHVWTSRASRLEITAAAGLAALASRSDTSLQCATCCAWQRFNWKLKNEEAIIFYFSLRQIFRYLFVRKIESICRLFILDSNT